MEALVPNYTIFGLPMNFSRKISNQFRQLLGQYPIVTVVGPRQSGKTTLATLNCNDYDYINLEDPETRLIAHEDPKALFSKYPERVIIDEIQLVPELLSYLQVIVDKEQKDGMFVITGSHQLALHESITQSLAGRTAILELLPLSMAELQSENIHQTTDELMLKGCYPRIYKKGLNPTQAYRDYVKTYIERDVRKMINLKDLVSFQRFMKLCASRTGCELNMSSLANDVGVSNHTIKHWLSILQASYLIHLVMPYFENFGKQVVKMPKLYFTDVGLATYLLEIESIAQLNRDPLRGQLFETLIYTELVKARYNQGREPNLYYYRDSKKNEVDLIYKQGSALVPIEVKSSQTIQKRHFKGLDYFRALVQNRCSLSYLVYAGDQDIVFGDNHVLNYLNSAAIVTPNPDSPPECKRSGRSAPH